MRLEVQRAFKRRLGREKRTQERRDLNPAAELQPRERAMHYTTVRSAMAEEGVIRLLLLDDSLFPPAPPLREEDFSSPLLGRVFSLLWEQRAQGGVPRLTALAAVLTGYVYLWLVWGKV